MFHRNSLLIFRLMYRLYMYKGISMSFGEVRDKLKLLDEAIDNQTSR